MDLSTIVTPEIIQGLLGLVSMFAVYAINMGAAYLKTKTKNEKVSSALGLLDHMLVNAVKSTEQTFKKDLIKASADGKLTDIEKSKLRHNVADAVHAGLTESVKKEILKIVPNIEQYSLSKVEEILHNMKASKNAMPKTTAAEEPMKNFGLGK